MKKFMKRFAGVALTLAMIVTMLPTQSAYAAKEDEKQETEEQIIWEHFDREYYANHENNGFYGSEFIIPAMMDTLVGSWDNGNVIITDTYDIILKRSNDGTIYSGLQSYVDRDTSTYIYATPEDVDFAATCTEKEAAEYDWPANEYYVFEPNEWLGSEYPDGNEITVYIETQHVIGNEYADYLVFGLNIGFADYEFDDFNKGINCWKVRYKDVDGEKVSVSEVFENYAKDCLGLNKPEPTPEPTATPVPTATPEPTSTPAPTATPEPTATPVPTATPAPTATLEPTATPEPTPTETTVEDKEVVGKTSDGRPYYKNEEVYKVVKDDCLWTIANHFFGNGKKYVELFERNNSLIKKPELIYTGWEIVIPVQN